MSKSNTVIVKILDKDYQVSCPPDQEAALHKAAKHLDQQMRGIRASGKVIGLERIAVMAALNMSHELLERGTAEAEAGPTGERVKKLTERLDQALQRFRQLEIG